MNVSIIRKAIFPFILIALISAMFFPSCNKDDDFITDPGFNLAFSTDSVAFDTVFTTLGSVTKQLKVYNNSDSKVNISSIRVAGGAGSMFRINVDGIQSLEAKNIEIEAHDSLFIFVKVTVNPNNQNNPLVVLDSIVFNVNNKIQDVKLVAWGQDAYYHVPTKYLHISATDSVAYGFAGCATSWNNDKPHVIFGLSVVDSDSILQMNPGTRVYMAPDATLWVYDKGSLKINGSYTNPVTIQGMRLESYYKELPGQWNKIWLSAGSKDNEINYAVIKNGNIGIQVDTVANSNPTLTLDNTLINNMSVVGLYAQGARIRSTNTLVANCGTYSVVLSLGGDYEFRHCTFANYWRYAIRKDPQLVLNNYYKDKNNNIQPRPLTNAYFGNCIIYGNNDEEIMLDQNNNAAFQFEFDHCLLKTKLSNISQFVNCLLNANPLFKDYYTQQYEVLQGSPAIAAGNPTVGTLVPFDIKGTARPLNPTLGPWEFVATPKYWKRAK